MNAVPISFEATTEFFVGEDTFPCAIERRNEGSGIGR